MRKKTLVLVASKKKRERYLDEFLAHSDDSVEYHRGSLEEMSFTIDQHDIIARNWDGNDVRDYDLVVFRTVGKYKKEAVALALVCDFYEVQYIDTAVRGLIAVDDENKLCEMISLRLEGVSVPATASGTLEHLNEYAGSLGYPVILKAINGKKGRNNYFISSEVELAEIINKESVTGNRMILQQYIPNVHDYRVLCLGESTTVVTLRRRTSSSTHLNNVSAGGTEVFVENSDVPVGVCGSALRASKALGLEVAGVDIVVDDMTGKQYIIEVNRAPEITLDEEFKEYFTFIADKILTKK